MGRADSKLAPLCVRACVCGRCTFLLEKTSHLCYLCSDSHRRHTYCKPPPHRESHPQLPGPCLLELFFRDGAGGEGAPGYPLLGAPTLHGVTGLETPASVTKAIRMKGPSGFPEGSFSLMPLERKWPGRTCECGVSTICWHMCIRDSCSRVCVCVGPCEQRCGYFLHGATLPMTVTAVEG